MSDEPPIPAELWARTPPDVQAAILAVVGRLERRLAGRVECRPSACRRCGRALDGTDPEPIRHQVAELPEVRPEVVEYRLHRLTCPGCGTVHRAKLPGDVPRGAFGPRL